MARWLGLALAIVLWEILARLNAGSFVIAGPIAVADYIYMNTGLLGRALGATFQAAVWGFLWGNLAACCLACLVVLFPRTERVVNVFALLVFCLPLVATGPILRVLYGPGAGPQITLAALAVYYTSYLALLVGLRAVPQSWMDLVQSYGRGSVTTLLQIRLRASVPYLIAALQIGAPVAFLGAMVGEFTGAERGLGVLTLRAMRGLDVDATWAIASIATAVSVLAFQVFGRLGDWLQTDRPTLLLSAAQTKNGPAAWQRVLTAAAIALLVVVVWQVLMDVFGLNRFFAKRPADVWTYLISGSNATAARETLFAALGQTLSLTFPGYFAGLLLGAGLAAAVVILPGVAAAILPVAVALRSVPIITTAPLIVLALGRGSLGTITIVAVMIFFPTLVACVQGLRQTPGQVHELFQTYAASRLRLLRLAQIPAMLPAFFAAARMAVPAALLAATTTEWLATGTGIGNLMALTASTSDYNMLWSAVVVLALIAMVFYLAVEVVEQKVLAVYASEQVRR